MIRSSRKPMMPMVNTATMMRLSDSELPFWNSSQTNFPSPGFCASISAAISTIQPTPSDRRMPVKMYGSAEGNTSLVSSVDFFRRSTRATLSRSRSIEPTPTAVLMTVGHSEHSVTVTAELMNDLSNSGVAVTYTALTIIVTMGSQASGDTGLNTWMSGLNIALNVGLMPHRMPSGMATRLASRNPANTVFRLVKIWSM